MPRYAHSLVSTLVVFTAQLLWSPLPGYGQTATPETIPVDTGAAARPFPHFWEQTFGSGRAVLTLRESWRNDAKAVHQATNFEFVRFHAVLHDEMGVYDEDQNGNPIYNFSYVDQVYDGLRELGLKPFVELSFMPRKLASSLQPHPFFYKQFVSPPKDPAKWSALIQAFARHLEERYGKAEVESWYFEVWNEPNIDFWQGHPQLETYFELYDGTARALKSVDEKLRVGGPATAQAAWVDKFIAHCTERHIPFDFVSTHVYGDDTARDVFGTNEQIPRLHMVARSVKKVYDQVKASTAPATPILWTEYNATYTNTSEITDTAFMGPWLANNIRECDGLTTQMAYWAVSDVFEEMGVIKKPFYGGYGLMAERSIPKAVFRDFELLHRLGAKRIALNSENALLTQRDDGTYVMALWNYSDPSETGSPRTFRLQFTGKARLKHYRMQFVAPGTASPVEAWRSMGSPSFPSMQQVQQLRVASALPPSSKGSVDQPIILGPKTLAVLELER